MRSSTVSRDRAGSPRDPLIRRPVHFRADVGAIALFFGPACVARLPWRRKARQPAPARRDCFATHSAVSPRAADGCFARMMGKPTGARLTSDGALLLSWGVVLLVRHERTGRNVTGGVHWHADVGVPWLSAQPALAWLHHQCAFRETRPAGSGSPCARRRRRFRCAVCPGTASRLLAGERRASEPVAPQQVFDLQDERDSHTRRTDRQRPIRLGLCVSCAARSPSPPSYRSRRAPVRSPCRSS